jgi:polyisoprenoid-binding protein YceI
MNSRVPASTPFRGLVAAVIALAAIAGAAGSSGPSATTTTKVHATGIQALPGSKLWIEGTSTMHGWSSVATRVDLTVAPAATDPGAVLRGNAVEKVVVTVPVAEMRSGKDGLDKNMRKALKADVHPAIVWTLADYTLAEGATADAFTVRTKGTLAVAGVEKPVEVEGKAAREGTNLRVRGTTTVLMSAFGVKPPAMMMGTLKTGDPVKVHFDLILAGTDAAAAGQP